MPAKKKEKVVNIEEVKEEIALVEEETKVDKTPANTINTGDESTSSTSEASAETSKVESCPCKKDKVKGFLKKHWKKIAIGTGVAAIGIGGYCIGRKLGINSTKATKKAINAFWNRTFEYLSNSDNAVQIQEQINPATGKTLYAAVKLIDKSELPTWFGTADDVVYEWT